MKKNSLKLILTLLCLILSTNSRKLLQKEELESLKPTSDNVKLIGRYYQDEDEEVTWLIQSGSAIEFYVTGSVLELVLVGDNYIEADEDMRPRYGIYLDDKEVEVNTINDEEYSINVFDNEEEETHKVKVMLLSENMFGGVGIRSINVASTAEEIIKPVEDKKILIEFVGDSITCGYGVEGKDQNEHFKTTTENFSKSYAYLTAQALDVDYSAVSYSGYGIVSGYSTGEKNAEEILADYYELSGKNKNYRKKWDFTKRQPDLIVINLGTNDKNYVENEPDTRKNEFIQGYANLLLNVREHNPEAKILCTVGVMGASELFPLIETSINTFGDEKVFTYLLPQQNMNEDGLGSDWHPSEKTQQKTSKLLVKKIKNILEGKTDDEDGEDDEDDGDFLSFLPTSENVKIIGRYYQNEDVTWLVQSGSAIEFYVRGTKAQVILVGDNSIETEEDYHPRYGIYLNDENILNKTINETTKTIDLFELENEKTFKVKVMLLSENMYGGIGIKKIKVISSEEEDAVKPVEKKTKLIEFIGDGITCGYGVEGKDQKEGFKTSTENFAKSYAYLTAQALNADYMTVAYGGHGIISGYSGGEKNTEALVLNYYETIGKNENYPGKWDFKNNQPDFVVINVGTNDNNYISLGSKRRKEDFIQGYGNFLLTVRDKNPKAIIICLLGTVAAEQVYPLMEKAVKSYGDEKTFVFQLPLQQMNDGYGSDWYPSEKTQQKTAKILVEKINEILEKEIESRAKTFLATSENVKIIGRYYQKDGVTWLIQSGSAVEFYVTGSYLSIEIVGDNSINAEENYRPRFAIFLDDQEVEGVILSEESSKYIFDLNEDKTFKVKIILLSENKYGGVGIKKIDIISNDEEKAIIPVGNKKMLIEFIGDSITCAFGVEGDKEEGFKTETENFMKSYAYLTAQSLDADYSTVCYSGYGVVSGVTRVGEKNDKDLVPKYYTILGKNENYPGDWDFEARQPNFIVINLGTNDNTYVRHDPDTRNDEFVEEYSEFLKKVRQNNPNANIICTVGTMWATELYPLIVRAVKSFGDEKITTYQSETQSEEDGIGSGNHPSPLTHQKSAKLLVEKINEILNKQQVPTEKTKSILLTEENVKITGRYYQNEDEIWLVQSGSAVEFYLAARFGEIILLGDSAILNDEDYRPRYGIYVDDKPIEIDLINDKEHIVTLFKEEEIRSKKIKIMLLSENTNGGIGVKTLNIISTVENPITPVEKKNLLIEFIGDSITCGYGVEGKDQNEHFKTSTENFSKSYAYLTAQALDADYSAVSYSGHGIISGYSTGDKNEGALVPELYTKIGKHENYKGEWDFENHQPDIIVINLGTNDLNYANGDLEIRGEEFTQEYLNFLDLVREKNPDAYIICTLGIMGATELYPYIETAITLTGDDRITSYQAKTQDMSDGLGSDWHPSPTTQKKSSEQLISIINEIIE